MEGWYYLHTNGSLIYKRELGGTAADIRDSDFARGLWPFDPEDREGAWRICVEGLAAGAKPERVKELATLWQCDDEDATKAYGPRIGCELYMDGNMWCAVALDHIDLAVSPAGFGETCLEAMAELAKELGYKPSKMWGATFADLMNARENSRTGVGA